MSCEPQDFVRVQARLDVVDWIEGSLRGIGPIGRFADDAGVVLPGGAWHVTECVFSASGLTEVLLFPMTHQAHIRLGPNFFEDGP